MAAIEPPGAPGATTDPALIAWPEPVPRPGSLVPVAPAARTDRATMAEALVRTEPARPAPAPETPPLFSTRTASIELAGQNQDVDIYLPVVLTANGVAIVAHGFGRSRVRHRDLGRALASAGITTVIPDLPHLLNLWGNGDALVELAQQLAAGALGLPPVERSRLVLIGTSAGGLATVLAAAELPGLAGWIGLDPVDRTDTGIAAAAKLTAPAVVLLAGPGGCNLVGSGRSIARAVPKLRRLWVFADASHCDFEDPTNNFCQAICGSASAAMQARIRSDVVAAALQFLPRSARRRDRGAAESQ